MAKTIKGTMKCETRGCGQTVVVKENENSTLSYHCDYCEKSAYARLGNMDHAEWLKEISPVPGRPPTAPPTEGGAKPAASSTEGVADSVPADQVPAPNKVGDMWGAK
jgi:hypothetical protein